MPYPINVVTLFDKPSRRTVDWKVDYTGFRSRTHSSSDMGWIMPKNTAIFLNRRILKPEVYNT